MADPSTYKQAGVDIQAANRTKALIKDLVRETYTNSVMSEVGGFGALFSAKFQDKQAPVLVSSADGVGTKLKVAFLTGIHHTVGYDLVCHCVNDILVQGAEPLFFLDYLALAKLDQPTVVSLIEGMVRACKENDCALIGGETAEMPGFYSPGEYDVAGFIVGVVDRKDLIDGARIAPGDSVLGLPSAGLHTNGYSLARILLFENAKYSVSSYVNELAGTIGEELLKPHRSYLPQLRGLLSSRALKGLAHITGGGLIENVPRILPSGCGVEIDLGSWPILPIFELLSRLGSLPQEEAYRVFNMGIGMVIICSREAVSGIDDHLRKLGEPAFEIGRVVEGSREVTLRPPRAPRT